MFATSVSNFIRIYAMLYVYLFYHVLYNYTYTEKRVNYRKLWLWENGYLTSLYISHPLLQKITLINTVIITTQVYKSHIWSCFTFLFGKNGNLVIF